MVVELAERFAVATLGQVDEGGDTGRLVVIGGLGRILCTEICSAANRTSDGELEAIGAQCRVGADLQNRGMERRSNAGATLPSGYGSALPRRGT